MNKILFLVFVVCAMSYKIATFYSDSDCSEVLETVEYPGLGTVDIFDDGSAYSGTCYEYMGMGAYTEFRCTGGDVEQREFTETDDCDGDWEEAGDDEDDDTDDDTDDEEDECVCDGSCCELSEDVMYMECYCKNLQASDAMLLTALILTFIPCCWIGCCCIIWFVALIMCCVCGTGCFATL